MRKLAGLAGTGCRAARRAAARLRGALGGGGGAVDRPWQYASAPDFHRRLERLERSQWWSEERFAAHQHERTARVVLEAFDRVPFYRRRWSEAGVRRADLARPETFHALPRIDRDDLQGAAGELRHPAWPDRRCRHVTTGGTSGRPVGTWQAPAVQYREEAFVWRHWRWAGIDFTDRAAICRGVRPPGGGAIGLEPRLGLVLSGLDLGWDSAGDYLDALQRHRPAFIRGYPFTLALLARAAARRGGVELAGLKACCTSSELLKPEQRRLIQSVFGAPVIDLYGHAERLVAAGECPQGRLHVFPEYGRLEVLDAGGAPAPAGAAGEIVATGFGNPAMPLIRYRTGDRGRLTGERCPCGRRMPVLALEDGREQDCLLTAAGRLVSASALNYHSPIFDGIERFRFVQHHPGRVEFHYVPLPGAVVDEREVAAGLAGKLGADTPVAFVRQSSLPPTAQGKHHFIVSTVGAREAAGRETVPC